MNGGHKFARHVGRQQQDAGAPGLGRRLEAQIALIAAPRQPCLLVGDDERGHPLALCQDHSSAPSRHA